MLYGILVFLFVILCITLILLILIQKGKSSIGLGSLGGGTQLLFGGSGGQDFFQKTTWVLGALFMAGSLFLAILKKPSTSDIFGRLGATQQPTGPVPDVPVLPTNNTSATQDLANQEASKDKQEENLAAKEPKTPAAQNANPA